MLSVLICDDSQVARRQVAKCLPQDWEVAVHYAQNGQEALQAIEQGKGDVLLLDLNMPVMDGYQTLQAIHERQLRCKVIVISGDIQPEAYQRVTSLGALDFIRKPVDPQKLSKVLVEQRLTVDARQAASEVYLDPAVRDCYQEITNIAMGQAGDHLARVLNVFVALPIPNVNLIEVSELHMMLSDIEQDQRVSGICQGFLGAGVAGEALFIVSDSSFDDIARMMDIKEQVDDRVQLEVLMDAANILIGACLGGLAEQMDLHFSQGHPVVLGQHRSISELLKSNRFEWQRTLAIEVSYGLEGFDVQCDLVILFTEASMEVMNKKLAHLMEDD